jgi:hypothetical protein
VLAPRAQPPQDSAQRKGQAVGVSSQSKQRGIPAPSMAATWPSNLPASPRLYPSSTKANANIRRVASASLLCGRRLAELRRRVIVARNCQSFRHQSLRESLLKPQRITPALICKDQLSQRSMPLVLAIVGWSPRRAGRQEPGRLIGWLPSILSPPPSRTR